MAALSSRPSLTTSFVGTNTHLPGLISKRVDHLAGIGASVVRGHAHQKHNQADDFRRQLEALMNQAIFTIIHKHLLLSVPGFPSARRMASTKHIDMQLIDTDIPLRGHYVTERTISTVRHRVPIAGE
ncbi:hypothetical protein CBM2599_B50292 [Cupriavidus taiwanensis]|nr:hypothetical protein CBM2600_B10696 [Cupriavidus taiwanensis]SOY96360.1 hypothetical protein CBM2599_B50292 [Cupriavidus taiwanensis]